MVGGFGGDVDVDGDVDGFLLVECRVVALLMREMQGTQGLFNE